MPSSSALPQKSLRASSHATAMPNGSATTVATTAIRSERRIAVHSSGVRENTTSQDVGRTRNVKPYCSNTALAVPPRRKRDRPRLPAWRSPSRRPDRRSPDASPPGRRRRSSRSARPWRRSRRRCRARLRRARPAPARRARCRPSRISSRPTPRCRASPARPWRICRPAPNSPRRSRCGRRRSAWRGRSPVRSPRCRSSESFGAISTSRLPSRLTRVSSLMIFFCAP